MEIDRALVEHIAHLARLGLSDEEAEAMKRHIQRMLDHVASLDRVDISNVPPLSVQAWTQNVFRDDAPHATLSQDEALANAPEKKAGGFLVPRVLGED